MPVPRLPVAPVPPPVAARERPRRKRPRFVALKVAAARADVSPLTMYRWCRAGRVEARRLAGGHGPWRVRLDKDGLPMDARPA
jgi:hypothetical protein